MKQATALVLSAILFSLPFVGAVCAQENVGAPDATTQLQSSALKDVQATLDSVVDIAQKYAGDANRKIRRQKLREAINPRFDFAEMSKRSLGSEWTKLNEEQQKEFTFTFSELLARSYLNKVETVKPGMVKVDSEKLDMPRSSVKTLVTSKGDVFPIEYRLLNTSGTWKVYDVVIENIGLVANYRNEFAGIIRKYGFDGLIQRLREKNSAAEANA